MNTVTQTPALDAETLHLFTDSVERYGQDKYGFDTYRALLQESPAFSKQAWSDYAQMGWLGAALPMEDGGFGSDSKAVAALMRFAGQRLALEPLFASAVVCGRLLALCGNDEAARSRLYSLAAGTRLFALAHAENTADAFEGNVQTTLNDGKLYGRKLVVLHGDLADELLVSVSEAANAIGTAQQRLSLYAVGVAQSGVRKTSYRLLDGRGAASFVFNGAAAKLLGQRGEGAPLLKHALLDARLALCAEAHGAMCALNRLTLAYLKDRRQFGRPIGVNQALQHRMVELYMLEQEASAVMAAAQRAGGLAGAQRERAVMGAVAHVIAAGRQISHEAVQMHGGIGTTHELAVGHYFKRIMVTNRLLGDRDVHLDAFARADAAAATGSP
ncbi:MAG: acyl-CoA dehydrogenase family protein [Burkholderiaceae bacterium]